MADEQDKPEVPDHKCHGVGHCVVCGAEEPPRWPIIKKEG